MNSEKLEMMLKILLEKANMLFFFTKKDVERAFKKAEINILLDTQKSENEKSRELTNLKNARDYIINNFAHYNESNSTLLKNIHEINPNIIFHTSKEELKSARKNEINKIKANFKAKKINRIEKREKIKRIKKTFAQIAVLRSDFDFKKTIVDEAVRFFDIEYGDVYDPKKLMQAYQEKRANILSIGMTKEAIDEIDIQVEKYFNILLCYGHHKPVESLQVNQPQMNSQPQQQRVQKVVVKARPVSQNPQPQGLISKEQFIQIFEGRDALKISECETVEQLEKNYMNYLKELGRPYDNEDQNKILYEALNEYYNTVLQSFNGYRHR